MQLATDYRDTPRPVKSFNFFFAGKDYFDHTLCHRLPTEGIFVLQCGDPTGIGGRWAELYFPGRAA